MPPKQRFRRCTCNTLHPPLLTPKRRRNPQGRSVLGGTVSLASCAAPLPRARRSNSPHALVGALKHQLSESVLGIDLDDPPVFGQLAQSPSGHSNSGADREGWEAFGAICGEVAAGQLIALGAADSQDPGGLVDGKDDCELIEVFVGVECCCAHGDRCTAGCFWCLVSDRLDTDFYESLTGTAQDRHKPKDIMGGG